MRYINHLIFAAFVMLVGVTAGRADTAYVITSDGNIRQIASDGTVTTFASENPGTVGSNGWSFGGGLAFDNNGDLYAGGSIIVHDTGGDSGYPAIFKITPDGTMSTFPFLYGSALAVDAIGDLYAADGNTTVEKITPNGTVSTFATGLVNPSSLAFGPNGNLYVACWDSTIKEIAPGGSVSTFTAGPQYPGPGALTFDSSGDLYVADGVSSIDKVAPNGMANVFATGLNGPFALAFGSNGELYVANNPGDTVSEISPEGTISTLATGGLQYPQSIAIQTPEPSSLALLSLGTFALLARRRRR
jgi:glucose/arabinose dehydrogenase